MISEETYYKAAAELTKRELQQLFGAISVEDIGEQDLSTNPDVRASELATIATALPVIEQVIRAAAKLQADEILRRASHMIPLTFSRGNLNFADVILERFRQHAAEHAQLTKPREEVDQTEVIPSITEGGR